MLRSYDRIPDRQVHFVTGPSVWALPELTMKNTNDNVAQISAEICQELTNR